MKRRGFSIVEGCVWMVIVLLLLCIIVPAMSGCEDTQDSADLKQAKATAQSMAEAERQVGMPAIKNYQERKLAKAIFELRDREDLVCYAYIVNLEGKLIFIGKCIGFGLPYSVQFTNPERFVNANEMVSNKIGGYQLMKLPQPDPNGLFMPQGLSATWLMMVDGKGEARPVYIEPEIIVSPFPLVD